MAVATPLHPRRRLTAPARREQLLDVATALVVERGFLGVSIELVSQRAGITRAVVYQHFPHLPALLEASVEREMTRALAQVSQTTLADLSEGDPRELMLKSLEAYLVAVRDHPDTWRLVLMPPEGAPQVLQERIAEGRNSVLASLTRAVRPALELDGPGEAELTARILSAVADEYARLMLTAPAQNTPQRLLAHANWLLQKATPET